MTSGSPPIEASSSSAQTIEPKPVPGSVFVASDARHKKTIRRLRVAAKAYGIRIEQEAAAAAPSLASLPERCRHCDGVMLLCFDRDSSIQSGMIASALPESAPRLRAVWAGPGVEHPEGSKLQTYTYYTSQDDPDDRSELWRVSRFLADNLKIEKRPSWFAKYVSDVMLGGPCAWITVAVGLLGFGGLVLGAYKDIKDLQTQPVTPEVTMYLLPERQVPFDQNARLPRAAGPDAAGPAVMAVYVKDPEPARSAYLLSIPYRGAPVLEHLTAPWESSWEVTLGGPGPHTILVISRLGGELTEQQRADVLAAASVASIGAEISESGNLVWNGRGSTFVGATPGVGARSSTSVTRAAPIDAEAWATALETALTSLGDDVRFAGQTFLIKPSEP